MPPRGSVKLIFAMLVNLVSLQQFHCKHMGISSDGLPSVHWRIGEFISFLTAVALCFNGRDEPHLPPSDTWLTITTYSHMFAMGLLQ